VYLSYCRLLFGIIAAGLVWITPFVIQNGGVPLYYYVVLILVYSLHQVNENVISCHSVCKILYYFCNVNNCIMITFPECIEGKIKALYAVTSPHIV
jgi:hypothetical protein